MKSTVSVTAPTTEFPFPKLMINPKNGKIILFKEEGVGVVVDPGTDDSSAIGNDNDDLRNGEWPMHKFVDFTGSVTLSNG